MRAAGMRLGLSTHTPAELARAVWPSYLAIGGISLERLPGVMACGVDGAAVVSAVTLASDPEQAVREGLRLASLVPVQAPSL